MHFHTYAIYNSNDVDILIIATRGTDLPLPDARIFKPPLLRAELSRIGIEKIADLRLRKIGDNQSIGPLLQQTATPPNSDFFPFVDLNASRLRFIRARATELSELAFLPLPYLELLGGSESLGPTAEPSANSTLRRDDLVRSALAIRRAVANGDLTSLDMASVYGLMLINANQDRCADQRILSAWKMAVQNMSDLTAAYLTSTELEEIWRKITASPCYQNATAETEAWVGLLTAVSRRDAANIVKFGSDLLGRQEVNSGADLAYIGTAMASSYIQTGQIAAAHRLLEEHWNEFDLKGAYRISLLSLAARSRGAPPALDPASQ